MRSIPEGCRQIRAPSLLAESLDYVIYLTWLLQVSRELAAASLVDTRRGSAYRFANFRAAESAVQKSNKVIEIYGKKHWDNIANSENDEIR